MIWGYHYFRKHPYLIPDENLKVSDLVQDLPICNLLEENFPIIQEVGGEGSQCHEFDELPRRPRSVLWIKKHRLYHRLWVKMKNSNLPHQVFLYFFYWICDLSIDFGEPILPFKTSSDFFRWFPDLKLRGHFIGAFWLRLVNDDLPLILLMEEILHHRGWC